MDNSTLTPLGMQLGPDMLDQLEDMLIATGKAGANGNTRHPLRKVWLASRDVLIDAGRMGRHDVRPRARNVVAS